MIRRLNEIAAQQKVDSQILNNILQCVTSSDKNSKFKNTVQLPDDVSLPLNSDSQLRTMEQRLARTAFMELLVSDLLFCLCILP